MQLPLWSITPFAVMLASIAILPLVGATKHWWEKPSSQLILALVLGVPTAIATGLAVGWEHVGGAVVEYIQFISLILSLFVVAAAFTCAVTFKPPPKTTLFSCYRWHHCLICGHHRRRHAAHPPPTGHQQRT